MSIFEQNKVEKNIKTKRLLAGFFDLSIIMALKTISDVVGNDFGFVVLGYYFLCYARYNTTIGGTLLDIKSVRINDEKMDVKYSMIKSAAISLIIFSIYYIFMSQDGVLKYALTGALVIASIIPMFLNKEFLTIHDWISRTKIVRKLHKDKSLIKESIFVVSLSFMIIALIFFNNFYTQLKCEKFIDQNDYQSITSNCKMATRISQDKDQYYSLGIAFLKQNKYSKSIKYFEKANRLGNNKAVIALIKAYTLNDDYKNAEEIAIDNIYDLSSSLLLSKALINKYHKETKDQEDLYLAYLYLYIYNKLYNDISLDKSVMSKIGQKQFLVTYYLAAQKYIKYAKERLSDKDIAYAQEEANSIISHWKKLNLKSSRNE